MTDNNELLFISVFNHGIINLALNHLESLKRQNITNYMAFVTDEESVSVLKSKGHPVSFLEDNTAKKEETHFDTPIFNTNSYLRYKIIKRLIQQGINVWYMDVDTVVLNDLRKIYGQLKNRGVDVFFQNDINMPCSGCALYFANPKTFAFVSTVEDNQTDKFGDQIIVREIISQLRFDPNFVKYATLNEATFPNGLLYFKEDFVNVPEMFKGIKTEFQEMEKKDVYFVHANWMIGNDTKTNALKKYGLWFLSD